ncbi:MAG: thioredoxin family protein [Patescibacteria group bacterium]|nr:thioredoxin family protein [Patescibacteria group bacterium]
MDNEHKKEEKVEKKDSHLEHETKHEHKKGSCCGGSCDCSTFFKKNRALIASVAAIILVTVGLIVFNPGEKRDVLTLDEAKIKAEKFINENFADPSAPISIVSIEEAEEKGLYKLKVDIGDGEIIDSYISDDGKKFFPQAFNMAELETNGEADQAEAVGSETSNTEVSDERFNEGADFNSEKKVVIYFFWGDGCPHCSNQKTAMQSWLDEYPDVEIKTYETWANVENRDLLESFAAAYDTTVQGVPMTFIGDKYWVGYADSLGSEMTAKIDECLEKTCENPGKRVE